MAKLIEKRIRSAPLSSNISLDPWQSASVHRPLREVDVWNTPSRELLLELGQLAQIDLRIRGSHDVKSFADTATLRPLIVP
jgi:hypothetical protein